MINQNTCAAIFVIFEQGASPGLLFYEIGASPGTTDETRIEACARGCLARVGQQWANWNHPYFVLSGFFVWPQTGASFCTASISTVCEVWKVTANDNANFKRYDFAVTDNRHQSARETAFSNEYSPIFTWPWLWREPSGGLFVDLDSSVNWAMSNGWNNGGMTAQFKTSFDKLFVMAQDAVSITVFAGYWRYDSQYLSNVVTNGMEGYDGWFLGSAISCSQQTATYSVDLTGTSLKVHGVVYQLGVYYSDPPYSQSTGSTTGDCSYICW